MVKLEANKHYTEHLPVEVVPLPKEVFVPLVQHIGRPCEPLVKVGQEVGLGEKIGDVDAFIAVPIHSPVSGKVKAIRQGLHPIFGRALGVLIENDGQDRIGYRQLDRSLDEILSLSKEELVAQIREAGIVGMGGATFPSYVKLQPKNPIDILVVNAAECEPYITSDLRLFLDEMDGVFAGMRIAMYLTGAGRAVIGVEDHNRELIKELRKYIAERSIKDIELIPLKSFYPQGGEKQLIKNTIGREVPLGGLPSDIGVVVHNVATLFAIYEALSKGKPLYERITTISGDGVNSPKNVRIRIGMSFKWILDFCGGIKEETKKVILGGPMMGFSVPSLDMPAIKGTGAILALTERSTFYSDDWECCIRCGRCVDHCPMGLMPADMGLALERGKVELSKEYGLMDCIECGVCTYVCPAKRPIVQWIKKGKFLARRRGA